LPNKGLGFRTPEGFSKITFLSKEKFFYKSKGGFSVGEIKILPEEVKKLIAAGEVVERPANVVKELIENSLDAEAKKIEIETLQAGKRLIVVRDNGKGILEQDLPLVIREGATSKISQVEDLYQIETFGFRGEALHSISRVSELYIASRHFTASRGSALLARGGKIIDQREVAHPIGTTVEVRNLFYNLPARLKFLKSNRTERKHIQETVVSYCLAYPEVYFYLEQEGKTVIDLEPSSVEERLVKLFNLPSTPSFAAAENSLGKAEIYYYTNYKSAKFYIFVNGRPVKNSQIQTYLKNKLGYRTLAALFIELPPYLIDVNVHPKKEEVRFIRERKVLELIGSLFGKKEQIPTPADFVLKQPTLEKYLNPPKEELSPLPTSVGFQILGQVEDTLIVAYREGFIYYFDQHLLDEVVNFHLLGDESKACRASLKAGQKLDKNQMEELLNRWLEIGQPRTCPHGRPIYYKQPLEEIYKRLDRKTPRGFKV